MAQKNVRKYPRVRISFSVEGRVGDKVFRERGTTLGGGGLFISTRRELPVGTNLVVRFRPAKHLPVIQAQAKVCYQVPGQGVGLEFTEISSVHRQMLLRLIHHKTGDRRKYDRAPLPTQIECEGCMSLAFSRDVSVGGMLIETKAPPPPGSLVTVRFHLDDGGPVVVSDAEVMYHVPKLGMGVQFTNLLPDDRKRIDIFVAKSAILSYTPPKGSLPQTQPTI